MTRAAFGAPLHTCPGSACVMCAWFLRIYNRDAQRQSRALKREVVRGVGRFFIERLTVQPFVSPLYDAACAALAAEPTEAQP